MPLTAGYVSLRQVRFRAFHGVLPQERQVGADFLLDLKVCYPLAKAMLSNSVDDTLNYATLYDLMAREMRQPSKLLEHVAGRMAEAICQAFPQVTSIDLELTKLNPPLGADCVGASIEVHFIKD